MNILYAKRIKNWCTILLAAGAMGTLASCEKKLDNVTYGSLSGDNFFKTANDAKAATDAMYTGLYETPNGGRGWASTNYSFRTQAAQTTDEMVCYWDDNGSWARLHALDFTPDFAVVTSHYTQLMQYVSQITVNMSKIQGIKMDETLKGRYIAELKALRAYFSQILYLYYGPVPVRLDASQIDNLATPPLPRPSKEEMINGIIKDFTEAIAVLPDKFDKENYGRFSKAACYTSLLKLYMQEKRWDDAIVAGEKVKAMGFSLIDNYADNFNVKAQSGNTEIILPVICSASSDQFSNDWLAHALPSDYYDVSRGITLSGWGGYRMPWKTYDKFDKKDNRLSVLLQTYTTGKDNNGNVIYVDTRARGDIGAIPVKMGMDPAMSDPSVSGINYVAFRYADVELLLAEAINEKNGVPNAEAYTLLNDVHQRAGLTPFTPGSLNQVQFRKAIQDERLFELWGEGVRRDDLIRWGLYIKRAKDDGSVVADDDKILYPIPRSVINQSNGVIQQNKGYK
ncbi:RagB/SusD family nutrient uptake outer membrane protein [Chitinophaga arvensicola]|uniref:Starch-binding associating with outer membrane n=1 Tax=Chitinophaga arvensicola TaxID=29529 RepID=A0A1I0S6R1_9BACT|nr:RagB/SusD family nutrient uptake outer membrane protein [Chitinophaga arvensicola]SEW51293.1 Starch-binding associating with outer membrane [Chitinophaga arvensicola]